MKTTASSKAIDLIKRCILSLISQQPSKQKKSFGSGNNLMLFERLIHGKVVNLELDVQFPVFNRTICFEMGYKSLHTNAFYILQNMNKW